MKSVRFAFLTFALPLALPAATAGASAPATAANPTDPSDLTSLRAKAERGDAVAQYNLGLAHLQGRQTPVNLLEAYAWLSLAAEGGTKGRALDAVLDTLSPDQLNAARRRLETLRAGNPYLRATAPSVVAQTSPATSAPIIGEPVPTVRPAPASTPIISIPPASPLGASELKRLQEQLAAREQEKRELAAELSSAAREIEQLKSQLAGRSTTANDLSAVQSKLREAQTTLARQTSELATIRAEAAAARTEQTKLQSELTAARTALSARNGAVAQASDAAAALERERAAHAATQSTLDQLKSQLTEANAARTTIERDAAARTAVAERAQATAADDAKKLSAQSAELTRKVTSLTGELTTARAEIASLRQTRAATDEKSAALRDELARTKTALEAATNRAQSAASRADAGAQAESQLSALRNQVIVIERDLEALRATSNRATAEKAAAETALVSANQKLADATKELNTLRQRTADGARQAAAAAEEKVAALQSELNETKSRLAAALAAKLSDAGGNKDELARALAAQAEAENKLSTALRSYTLVARERDELQARVADLSAGFSTTKEALSAAEAKAKAVTDSATASVAATAELETLRNRAAAAERDAESARVELARANQLLAAYRPTHAEPARPTAPAGQPARTHTIAPGETLSSISIRYYGTASRWPEILNANRDVLVDEHSFTAGRTLRIP